MKYNSSEHKIVTEVKEVYMVYYEYILKGIFSTKKLAEEFILYQQYLYPKRAEIQRYFIDIPFKTEEEENGDV